MLLINSEGDAAEVIMNSRSFPISLIFDSNSKIVVVIMQGFIPDTIFPFLIKNPKICREILPVAIFIEVFNKLFL